MLDTQIKAYHLSGEKSGFISVKTNQVCANYFRETHSFYLFCKRYIPKYSSKINEQIKTFKGELKTYVPDCLKTVAKGGISEFLEEVSSGMSLKRLENIAKCLREESKGHWKSETKRKTI